LTLPRETRLVQGRPVLASNSVLIVASAPAGAAAELDTFAAHLVTLGFTIHAQTGRMVSLYRFEVFVAPLLAAAHAALRGTPLAASATMAVKVRSDGREQPSPKSLDIGTTLAREASAGNLVLSLRLASLLQATEPECARLLRTTSVPMANGHPRGVVLYDGAASERPQTHGGIGQLVGALPPALIERLVYRIYQRAFAAAPGVSEDVVRDAVLAASSAVSIAQRLARHAAPESHAALRLIVDDEVRSIRLRGEAGEPGRSTRAA
jgi:hypothetical protein